MRHHTNVVQFQMNKPAHLPFHLLAWGQQYVRVHNCYNFYADHTAATGGGGGSSGSIISASSTVRQGVIERGKRILQENESNFDSNNTTAAQNASESKSDQAINSNSTIKVNSNIGSVHKSGATAAQIEYFNADHVHKLDSSLIPAANKDAFEICAAGAIITSVGGPVKVVYLKKFDIGPAKMRIVRAGTAVAGVDNNNNSSTTGGSGNGNGHQLSSISVATNGTTITLKHYPAIKYVYFTESDQVVRFDTLNTLHALTAASNDTTFFVGKRREKARDSDPADYMGALNSWRECGVPGYSLSWPKDKLVRID